MLERIGTYAQHQRLTTDMNKTLSNIATLQTQISSGNKASTFEGLNGQVELFTGLQTKVNRADTYVRNNSQVISRLNTMDASLTSLQELTTTFIGLTVGEISPSEGVTNIVAQVENMLATVSSLLNNDLEGRYLFAGSKTDTRPVPTDLLALNTGAPSQTPNDAYYRGDDVKLSTKGSDSLDITYGITANDSAFQELIAAMYTVINSQGQPNAVAYMQSAENLAQSAFSRIATLRADLGSNVEALENANDIQGGLILYWKGFSQEVASTDIAEASTQVAVQETIIQATFQTFAVINNLKLSDYL
ncbi:MAG: hypothetical protein J0L97_00980 [Alphaproteobacteria bacterium]|nr:hypothetical protein [Alphaproteobacteria bacterium]